MANTLLVEDDDPGYQKRSKRLKVVKLVILALVIVVVAMLGYHYVYLPLRQ